MAVDWLELEKVLSHFVLLKADCLVEEAHQALIHGLHSGMHVDMTTLHFDGVVKIDELQVFCNSGLEGETLQEDLVSGDVSDANLH